MGRPPRCPPRTTKSPASRRRSRGTSTNRARPGPILHFVGGKGGVGKTTCAAALALTEAAGGRRTLLLSTDPASSLGDALGQRVSQAPRPVGGRVRLHAVDVDAPQVLARWLRMRRPVLAQIALRGTWLDEADVSRLLRLTLPGIDEIAALIEISRYLAGGRYDAVVVDTAPTGHTLRMLGMPSTLRSVAAVFDHMQAKHRAIAEALRGRWVPDAADLLVQQLDTEAHDLTALLRDTSRVRVSWVTLPEPLAVAETIDALQALFAADIRVTRLIVNRLTSPPPEACGWCNARRTFEAGALTPLHRAFSHLPFSVVTNREEEPRGLAALSAVGRELERPVRLPVARGAVRKRVATTLGTAENAGSADVMDAFYGNADVQVPSALRKRPRAKTVMHTASPSSLVQLLIFGGKGGVGKTTCAAAAALTLARRHRERRVLLLSTDPAHSLGDALGTQLSDETRVLAGGPDNLRVRELDAMRAFQQVRRRYSNAIDEMFDGLSRGSRFDATYDRQVMRDLIDLAPPGVDELAAILEVTDALAVDEADARRDLLVVDTAPSGHALRLLQMPAIVQDWAKALMAILLRYQPIVRVGDLGAVLLRLSQGTGRLRRLLSDSSSTRFIAVTRPASLPRAETLRLIGELRAMKIEVAGVIVNAVGAGTCGRCRRTTDIQRREVTRLRRTLRPHRAVAAILAPAETPPPNGPASLERWAQRWSRL